VSVPVHSVAVSNATVAVHLNLNRPFSLSLTVSPSVTSSYNMSVNEYVEKVDKEVQVSTSPTSKFPRDGEMDTPRESQSINNDDELTARPLAIN